MLKIKKAFSLIEALVAIFVLSMITLTYMNSSSVFIRQQADLINKDRLNQIADLILQDIMEYVKIENNLYGSIFADIQEIGTSDKTLEISNVTSLPKAGDIFIIADQPRRYTVASISGSMPNDVIIRTVENLPRTSSLPQSKLTFIAFKKNDLSCFDGLNLTNDSPPDSLENCAVLPEKVEDLFNHWKSIVEAEFGDDITVQTIDIDDQGLVKVTLGDANKNVTLAKKINKCIFDTALTSINFTIPGEEPIETGIISGPEHPTLHSYWNGRAFQYANLNSNWINSVNGSCSAVGVSTCRQSYSWEKTISVFLYRYTGANSLKISPVKTFPGSTWEDDPVIINPQDLSLWIIFGEFNGSENQDLLYLGEVLDGYGNGFVDYTIRNLPNNSRVLLFDDYQNESCADNVDDGNCEGRHRWQSDHDSVIFHLGTNDLSQISNIEFTLTGNPSPMDLDAWRFLKNEPNCLIASGEPNSAHGTALNREEKNTCWNYVSAKTDSLAQALTKNQMTMRLNDSSKFPASGNLQVGSEFINYSSNNTQTNTITISSRGVRPTGYLTEAIPPTGNTGDWKLQEITDGKLLTGVNDGFVEIGNEIFRLDNKLFPNNNFSNIDNNIFRFTQRRLNGSSYQAHNIGDAVRSYDMRAQTWPSGTTVYEGTPNTIPVIMQMTGSGNNYKFPRKRIKKKFTLNVSTSSVCS